jgi:DNA-directed RNA polymerase specialized sigma24 family protein
MDDKWLAERFEADRTRLQAVAYRLLGSASEADDAVQEAWLRLSRSDTSAAANLGGWLTTVVSRLCLDRLRSRRSRPEEPLPRGGELTADAADPEREAMLAESGWLTSELRGAEAVAKKFAGQAQAVQLALIDGVPGGVWAPGGKPRVVFGFTTRNGKVAEIELLADRERLSGLNIEILV